MRISQNWGGKSQDRQIHLMKARAKELFWSINCVSVLPDQPHTSQDICTIWCHAHQWHLNNLLSLFLSGFWMQNSTVTAVIKVFSDIINALGCRQICFFFLFIEGFWHIWSWHSFKETSHCCSVSKGGPQGSVLGPILFSLFINNICDNILNARSL